MTTDLCEPMLVGNIVNTTMLPPDCPLADFSITARSEAGESQPSLPATVNSKFVIQSNSKTNIYIDGLILLIGNKTDFCLCIGKLHEMILILKKKINNLSFTPF